MSTLLKKLSSRKLWACIAGIVIGAATAFGLDEGVISVISGSVVSVISVAAYICTEGKVDAGAVWAAAESLQDAAEAVTDNGEGQ